MNTLGALLLLLVLQQVVVDGRANYDLEEDGKLDGVKRSSIFKLFSRLDVSGDGALQWAEWHSNVLTSAEPEHGVSERDLSHQRGAFDRIDTDKNGVIGPYEFLATTPNFGEDQTVQQVHLSLTGVDTEMVVVWITDENTTTSEVLVGTASGSYPLSFFGFTTTYDVGELGGWHKIIHVVKAISLSPATKYYYKCGDATAGYSPEYYFTTPPPPSPTVYGLVADMGTYIPLGFAVAKQVADDNALFNFSMVVHAGDIAYAGTSANGEIEEVWDVWGGLVEPVASLVPYMVAIGNHEDYYNRTSFMHRFYMPTNGGNQNLWYSMDHGNVHWIFFSTQDPYIPASPQYQWLEQDLIAANNNRGKVAWIIFVTHRPMYCSDTMEESQHIVGAAIQVALEPILVQYGVDIYFCGHMHMYERINPVINGTVVQTANNNVYTSPKAPMHIVAGTAGAFTDHKYIEPQPAWSAVRNADYGYGKLVVYNNSALQFTFMVEESRSSSDEFWILK